MRPAAFDDFDTYDFSLLDDTQPLHEVRSHRRVVEHHRVRSIIIIALALLFALTLGVWLVQLQWVLPVVSTGFDAPMQAIPPSFVAASPLGSTSLSLSSTPGPLNSSALRSDTLRAGSSGTRASASVTRSLQSSIKPTATTSSLRRR